MDTSVTQTEKEEDENESFKEETSEEDFDSMRKLITERIRSSVRIAFCRYFSCLQIFYLGSTK